MTTRDHDTDPSTPGAKRVSEPFAAARPVGPDDRSSSPDPSEASGGGVSAVPGAARSKPDPDPSVLSGNGQSLLDESRARSRPKTDPGIAPPSAPLPASRQPMGIIVPPVAPKAYDSIDVLLDGITRDQPERPRTTSQTDGQPVATYHAEHLIRAARASPNEEPKVVIDRPPLGQTIRVGRSGVSPDDAEKKEWTETTAIGPQVLAGRVLIAMVAGVVVVVVIFLALERISSEKPLPATRLSEPVNVATAAAAAPVAAVPESPDAASAGPLPLPMDAAAPANVTVAAESLPIATPAAVVNGAVRRVAPVPKPNRPKLKAPAFAPRPTGADLGEFKGSF
jgi:hypothetical protein